MTFGSLFAGIGGFDLGFERAGMECRWQVEKDPYCQQVLRKHWPDVGQWDDVCTFPPAPAEDWYVDVICGGFPCQDISYAGRGAGLEGERSGLFFESIRVVQQLRPRIVVLENVAALLTRGLDRVLGELAEIGFDAEWHCIPAAAVGAPHIRDRVFVIAHNVADTVSDSNRTVGETTVAVGDGEDDTECRERRGTVQPDGACATGRAGIFAGAECEGLERRRREHELRIGTNEIEVGGGGWWATEPDVGRVANGVPSRVHRLRCLGNAVVPQVAEYIGHILMKG